MKRYLTISIILHVLLILGIGLSSGSQSGSPDDGGDGQYPGINNRKIQERPTEVEYIAPETDEGEGPKADKITPVADCEDKDSFGGIGIYFDRYEPHTITTVVPGYSASRAGVQVGDEMLTDFTTVKGKVGTLLEFKVYRPSERRTITFILHRDKVCLKDVMREPNH